MSTYLPLLSLIISCVSFGYVAHLSLTGTVVALGTFVVMAVPGIVLLRRVWPEDQAGLPVLVFGSVLGLALGRFCLVATSLVCGPGPLGVGIALLVLIGSSALAFCWFGRRLLPGWDDSDAQEAKWIGSLLTVLFFSLAVVYWGVGRPTPQGFAFVPYFDLDYLNHASVTAELTRGIPPENPDFAGERLHYYWGYHLWPAAIKSLTGVSAREALTATVLPTVALFVAAVGLWLRSYLSDRVVRYAAVGVGLFASSYLGLLALAKLALPSVVTRVPGLSGGGGDSMLSHCWFRDFLYEPHAVTALSLFLAVMVLNHARPARHSWGAGCLIGVGFGAMMVTDTFVGMVGLVCFAVTNLSGFFRDPPARPPLLLAAGVTVLVFVGARALGVFPDGNRALGLGVHPMTKVAPLYLLGELGPLFVFGVVGAGMLLYRGGSGGWLPLVALLGSTLLLGFCLRMAAVEPNIVLRKSLKVLQFPFVALTAVALRAVLSDARRFGWAAVLVVVPGLVTRGTDTLKYLDLIGPSSTTYVTGEEMEMLDWVRANTPSDAVLLTVNPDRVYGAGTDRLIVALGERRTYYDNDFMPRVYQVPAPLIEERKEHLRRLFAASDAEALSGVLADLPPLYLYVAEQSPGPIAAVRVLEERGALRLVHRSGQFSLKQVVKPTGTAPNQ